MKPLDAIWGENLAPSPWLEMVEENERLKEIIVKLEKELEDERATIVCIHYPIRVRKGTEQAGARSETDAKGKAGEGD